MGKFIDLTGKRFGKLLVIKRIENHYQPSGQRKTMWLCDCDCGNKVKVQSSNLKTTKSCGCSRNKKPANYLDLTGNRFGKLIVEYDTRKRAINYTPIWHCICDCGGEIDTTTTHLRKGDTRSCGCISESFIASEIKEYFLNIYNTKKEYKILKNPKTKHWLPYDIYIFKGENPEINGIYIEINGFQHYYLNGWHNWQAENSGKTSKEEFEYQKYKDKLKKDFAKKNGTYIEVDLRKIKSSEQAIKYIENAIII